MRKSRRDPKADLPVDTFQDQFQIRKFHIRLPFLILAITDIRKGIFDEGDLRRSFSVGGWLF